MAELIVGAGKKLIRDKERKIIGAKFLKDIDVTKAHLSVLKISGASEKELREAKYHLATLRSFGVTEKELAEFIEGKTCAEINESVQEFYVNRQKRLREDLTNRFKSCGIKITEE